VPLVVTGNPARPAFEQIYREAWLQPAPNASSFNPEPAARDLGAVAVGSGLNERRLIIIGGAGGARSLNENMPAALARLRDQLDGWQIIHQSGDGQLQETVHRYRAAGVDALVVAFIDELAPVMSASDLVICRPGGTTLAELSLAGIPAILVPHPRVIDDHLPNAEVFARAGAATIIDESEPDNSLEDSLVAQLDSLLTSEERRQKMAANMRRLARPGAAANVTSALYEILFSRAVRLAA
jgi:UDP-N-acetylglucosamine--N-acetylmuramyl-(pentapeptide) pyrophosphoryl-undecaprenol N-acetylglucosamine transferase